jgi:dipeptidyl aminopeptidase/acylaminoacyl peptidase
MTDKYAAAMAGAPVSNMFSAYGGIRWASGLSRMFQYERTQSRIGYTIWEKPELYIENSPLFHLDKVNTPLLIMHNDGDGAVPWYQGIELFMGLRRLDEPVWLLNYNGDGHNLMETANRKDLSIRMKQFFDYYLMDYSLPEWMSNGIPAIDKGKNYGLTPKIQ